MGPYRTPASMPAVERARVSEAAEATGIRGAVAEAIFAVLVAFLAVAPLFLFFGCLLEVPDEASQGPVPPAQGMHRGQDLDAGYHRTESWCPPAAKSQGKEP